MSSPAKLVTTSRLLRVHTDLTKECRVLEVDRKKFRSRAGDCKSHEGWLNGLPHGISHTGCADPAALVNAALIPRRLIGESGGRVAGV
jgi:hypothetical protein